MTRHLSYNSTDSPGKPLSRLESEGEQVQLARQGDGSAFAQLFHHYNTPICTYLARLVSNDELGRDLAQETFLRAWKSLPDLSSEQRFRPWLYRIATNVARSHQRHERLIRWLPLPNHEQESRQNTPLSLSVEGPEEQTGERELVRQILSYLGPRARACVLLQFEAGFSQREIAMVLTIREKSVSAYVSRGCKQFRQLYHQMKGDAHP